MNLAVRDEEGKEDAPTEGNAAEALARRAAARDAEAWGEIFERHYRLVFGFVRYRLRGADEAEDVASHVFEIAYGRAERFDYRGAPIEAWLLGIARNLLRDHAKRMGRRGMPDDLDEADGPVVPDESEQVDLRHDLTTAMRELTGDQQEVITLRFLMDRSVTETAAIMDRSEDAVKNLQRRALAAMLRALRAAEYPGTVGR